MDERIGRGQLMRPEEEFRHREAGMAERCVKRCIRMCPREHSNGVSYVVVIMTVQIE